jgi:branched-chain amino acid transport system substrate-binding protein
MNQTESTRREDIVEERMKLLGLLTVAAVAAVVSYQSANAQASGEAVKIGVITDLSSLYTAIGGKGSVLAANMAVEDFGGQVNGKPIEVIAGDHQNKADVAAGLARRWVDVEGVTAFADVATSSTALVVQDLEKRQQKAVVLLSGPGTRQLGDEACSPVGLLWTWNTYSFAVGTAKAAVEQGNKRWFILTADYAFGHALEKDATDIIKANGGEIVGVVRHPINAVDFSSFLLQAQQSGAGILGLANAGGDTINAIKQANEFGLPASGMKIAALAIFITDIHSLGLDKAKGLLLTTPFYWNRTPESREWSMRFFKRQGAMPTMVQAGVYSSVMHYLKAVKAAGTVEPNAVVAKMREMPVNDFFATNARLREDNVLIHDMYLAQVKTPEESKEPWDYYKILQTIPANDVFWPLSSSKCPMVTQKK